MQLVNSLLSTLANPPASSGVRSFHSLPHYLWLVRSAPFAKCWRVNESPGTLDISLPWSLVNTPASSGVRSFHSLHHFSMARPLRSLRQIPLPHPALEATRWHFLPTVGDATSRLPALPMLPPKGASLIIPNRQLSGRASGNADNYFLIIARDNNNYRHCLRAALGSHLRSVSPLPHPALEATRWHFLPTVGAATSWPPALPVLPPKGASQIIPNSRLSAA